MAADFKYQVKPSLDRVNVDWTTDPDWIPYSGQHRFTAPDAWKNFRWNSIEHFLLSWADPHIVDQRYGFYEDDFIMDVYPEVNAPWKFPERVYTSNDSSGVMLEPPYFDPDPTTPPSGSKHYMVQDPALPEFRMRLVEASGIPVKAVTWGQEKNIPSKTKLLIAPWLWQGTKAPEIGEFWELQDKLKTVPELNDDGELVGYSGQEISSYQDFPRDPIMPHGDPEPFWNDGLDDKRYFSNQTRRAFNAHKRGSSDRFLNRWGEYTKTVGIVDITADGVETNTAELNADDKTMFLNNYSFKELSETNMVWADPAHFNEINEHVTNRSMSSCLTCFNKHKCRAANSLHNIYGEQDITGKTGALGFIRYHYVDVPRIMNPDTDAGRLYADSFCMYSTGSLWEHNGANKPTEEVRDDAIKDGNVETIKHNLLKYNTVSDMCHVNGMSRRAVEYDGHYRLLVDELSAVIGRDMKDVVDTAIKNNNMSIIFPGTQPIPCIMQRVGQAYDGDRLYRLDFVEPYPTDVEVGQYAFEYGVNADYTTPTLAWFTVRFDPRNGKYNVRKVWGYIWYIDNNEVKENRTKIKRLVEIKPDYGSFYGNVMEVYSDVDFSGGITPSSLIELDPELEAKRGAYVEVIPGRWIWDEDAFDLAAYARSRYIDPSGTQATGTVSVKGLPGDIIPSGFLVYTPPKMIKWEYSDTDRNIQTNIGKTRFWWNERYGKHQRGVGDMDDLFYHLSYQEPELDADDFFAGFNYPATVNPNLGAMKNYLFPNPPGEGFYEEWKESSIFQPPTPSSINTTNRNVALGNTYADFLPSGQQPETEPNAIDYGRIALMTDMQHARNFTAPVFGYEITTDIPKHEIVKPDFPIERMDWCRREMEPLEVAAQREYSPVPPMWCFAQNSENREVRYNINLGTGQVDSAEGNYPIKIIWNPAGRVWWNRRGLLGCIVEKKSDGIMFIQEGVAVVNLWRKIIPHHMEVVKAYLFLEPSLEHNIGALQQIGDRTLPGFSPFQGIDIQYDDSERKNDVGDSWYWANYGNRVHKGNQFLGGRIVGQDVDAQMDSPEIWDNVKEHSPKILGDWNFPVNAPLNWGGRSSTVGYTEWDLYHRYDKASVQNRWFIMENMYVTVNGVRVNSMDPDEPGTLHQRDPKWYDILSRLYEDDVSTFDEVGSNPSKKFYNNANIFQGINRSNDAGEGNGGKPDPLGKGYGFSRRGGGWKAPYIFDITSFVQSAYADRFDAEFITVEPVYTERKKSWEE